MQTSTALTGLLASIFLLSQSQVFASECSAKTGNNSIPLLELYTSEGCSSCPPADKWISQIKHDKSKVTPLAFHVDYWDYIGWKDQFSKAEYSDRQRKTAAFGGAGFVYTPQFVFNGRDFKGWDDSRLHSAINEMQEKATQANLSLSVVTQANGSLMLKTNAESLSPDQLKSTDIYVALYENGLVTNVQAGENAGRQLKHDYVVRKLFGAYQINNQNQFSKNFTLHASWANKNAGAAIFLQDSTNGRVIQSLALDFCR